MKHVFFMTNGTVALHIVIRSTGLNGEVVTFLFSYVVTTSSLVWERCKPDFSDIGETTFCISPLEIRKKITKDTTCILATHVYGFPCPIEEIQAIASEYNLRIICDAAHTFGCRFNGQPLTSHGDISMVSFYATKIFYTIECGILLKNHIANFAQKISYMRNFGHNGSEDYWGVGINGKASEFQVTTGLTVFSSTPKILEVRRKHSNQYREKF